MQVTKGAAAVGGDVTRGDGEVEATVPGSAVEMLSRLVAGKPLTAPATSEAPKSGPGAAAAAAASAAESKKAAAARAAAGNALAPLLPGLTALAASTSCRQQYSEWLLLALESASQTLGEHCNTSLQEQQHIACHIATSCPQVLVVLFAAMMSGCLPGVCRCPVHKLDTKPTLSCTDKPFACAMQLSLSLQMRWWSVQPPTW